MATLVQPKWFVVDRRVGATISEFGLFRKYFLNRDLSLRSGDPEENDIYSNDIIIMAQILDFMATVHVW